MYTGPTGVEMGNVAIFEGLPVGFATVTAATPGVVKSAAGMMAFSVVALTNWVLRPVLTPLKVHVALAPETKLVPLIIRLVSGLIAGTLAGNNAVILGVGDVRLFGAV